jgi:hypothetical protein
MPRIRCSYMGCVYREGDYCRADEVELDPDQGCLTFTLLDDLPLEEEEWDELFEEDEDFFQEEDDDDDAYDPSEWN